MNNDIVTIEPDEGLKTWGWAESLRVPARAARACTSWPSRVCIGLASAVETGRSTWLGKEAHPASKTLKNTRASHGRMPPGRRACKTKNKLGPSATVVCMMLATLAYGRAFQAPSKARFSLYFL